MTPCDPCPKGTVTRADLHKHSVRLAGFEPATPALGGRRRTGTKPRTCGDARHSCRQCKGYADFTDLTLTRVGASRTDHTSREVGRRERIVIPDSPPPTGESPRRVHTTSASRPWRRTLDAAA